jgi:hypothetical protein
MVNIPRMDLRKRRVLIPTVILTTDYTDEHRSSEETDLIQKQISIHPPQPDHLCISV